ncbi:MAG: 3-phosphoshikimate 1-carboxyvinyltransferase [Phycisphaerae bacterium]|nr:3-phosphoshikimate 1-carboxyvinyltransferase [Phycisphaerae bacterium]MDD5380826.1 3-phosphoshikimate 1-carboxyvinyltransferase [Phycisphaerae bacterium]
MKIVNKIRNTDVTVDAPPSKAHTLRALIISSLSAGECTIYNPLFGEDQRNVIECLKRLGIKIEAGSDKLTVTGTGGKYTPVKDELNVGESGVGMNFLTSAANLSDKPIVITGSKRITERPIGEVVEGLRQLGCRIDYLDKEGFPPIKVYGGGIKGGQAQIRGGECSQYFSSIVISSPYAEKKVTLKCVDEMTEKPYFDISLQMMAEFGIKAKNSNYKQIEIPKGRYSAREITIEGDYSSASFFFLAGAICKAKVTVKGLRPDTKQGDKAFLPLMEQMGCEVSETNDGICITGRKLTAIEQDMSDLPDLVPPVAIACAFAKGESRLTNIGHLRNKECDRLAVMASELGKMGAEAACDENSLIIKGGGKIHGAQIDPHNDHRIAMSFAVAGLATGDQAIENEMCVAKSFPDFWEKFEVFYK